MKQYRYSQDIQGLSIGSNFPVLVLNRTMKKVLTKHNSLSLALESWRRQVEIFHKRSPQSDAPLIDLLLWVREKEQWRVLRTSEGEGFFDLYAPMGCFEELYSTGELFE